jgi:hypothetical protein
MSGEEKEKATRSVYVLEGAGDDVRLVKVGDKLVDKAECERNLSTLCIMDIANVAFSVKWIIHSEHFWLFGVELHF